MYKKCQKQISQTENSISAPTKWFAKGSLQKTCHTADNQWSEILKVKEHNKEILDT